MRTQNRRQIGNASYIQVENRIDIDRSAQEVFDYVTTAALWYTWHPATVEVRNVPNRPLTTGETILEFIAVAGRHDQAVWTVVSSEPPRRWEIVTDTQNGAAHITYVVTPTNRGCCFQRTLQFRSKRFPWRLLDSTLTRWILTHQSARALHNVKNALELRRPP